MGWNVQPTLFGDAAAIVQTQFALHDFAKQTGAVVGADGDEIRPRLDVIVSLQADGSAMVAVGVIQHGLIPLHIQAIAYASQGF